MNDLKLVDGVSESSQNWCNYSFDIECLVRVSDGTVCV